MHQRFLSLIFLAICLVGESSFAAIMPSWNKVSDKDGIKTFVQKVDGSDLLAFRGECLVEAPFLKVASVVYDNERAKEWVKELGESKIIKWFSPTEFLEYDHLKAPFILKDRDFLSLVKIGYDKALKKFSFIYENADPQEAPEDLRKTKYVRAVMNGSKFFVTSLDDGKKSLVEGEIYADPKGFIPKWIVNIFQEEWPTDTFSRLRKQALKSDIQDSPKILEMLNE